MKKTIKTEMPIDIRSSIEKKTKNKFLSLCLVLSLNFTSFLGFATQTDQQFKVTNNQTIMAIASKNEITRIAFESDVVEINAIAGELEYVVQGPDIYLRAHTEKPVNFFVKLEQGISFKFILAVEDIPATQIFVNVQSNSQSFISLPKTHYHEHVSAKLKSRISKIINVALKPKKHLGYEITAQTRTISSPNKNIKMQLVGIISGNKLIAEKIYLHNKSDLSQDIDLKHFMDKNNLAIYAAKTSLLPKEECVLIRITEH